MYSFTVYHGTFIHLPLVRDQSKPTLVRNRGALWVSSADGRIHGFDWNVQDEASLQEFIIKKGWVVDAIESASTQVKIFRASEEKNEFFFPGFIDTHIHAPQYPNAGLFGSSTLLDWLETYTFPMESSFGGSPDTKSQDPVQTPQSALRIYDQVVARTLSHGTTCASYFATIHVPATNALAAFCHKRGQRALIGRVCMDDPAFCPSYYRDDSPEASVSATTSTIEFIHTLDPTGKLVKPVITPRFAPTCSRGAMRELGNLAKAYSPPLHIQTHISENTNEVELVKSLFPELPSYAAVYDAHGLLTPRTILAHAVHLSKDERALIASRDAKISHCPASNSALGSGICPVRLLLDEGLTVGLGTDVSGGYSPSILEAARQACLASRLIYHTSSFEYDGSGREKLSVEESLYLATRGGAAVVDMAGDIGGFDEGMLWDAQLIQLGAVGAVEDVLHSLGSSVQAGPVGNVDLFGEETWEEMVQKWVWNGDDRNVKAVWVGGRLVHGRE